MASTKINSGHGVYVSAPIGQECYHLFLSMADLVIRLSHQIENNELCDQLGRILETRLTGGLVNAERNSFFSVYRGIAKRVIGDALKLPGFDLSKE